MKWFFSVLAKIFGSNCELTPKEVILDQMNEPRALPMGKAEFISWSDRIISGALIPNEKGLTALDSDTLWEGHHRWQIFVDSQRFALANLLLHLGPTESHKPDAFFIHSLRKFAVNQVADAVRVELRDAAKARTALEEKKNETAGGQAQGSSEALVQNT